MAETERNGMRKEFPSRNAPLGLQEHQKGIRPKRNGRNGIPGIPQNGGSRIKETKKGMHNLELRYADGDTVCGHSCYVGLQELHVYADLLAKIEGVIDHLKKLFQQL